MYYQLAHLYDWPGSLDFSEQILGRDLAIFEEERLIAPARIIDLACGTGTLALGLARRGFEVTGIDLSVAMLDQAREKQARLDPEGWLIVRWELGDMRFFGKNLLSGAYDAVLCHYDSLNHLSNESELRAAFLQVAQVLKPGGLFLFDLNTLENYRQFWNGGDRYEGPNYRLQTESRFDESSGQASVTFSVDQYTESGELEHLNERVSEQYFNEAAVEKYLLAAEFHEIRTEPFSPLAENAPDFPLKTFWRCRRRPA